MDNSRFSVARNSSGSIPLEGFPHVRKDVGLLIRGHNPGLIYVNGFASKKAPQHLPGSQGLSTTHKSCVLRYSVRSRLTCNGSDEARVLPTSSSYSEYMQASANSRAHALNGNTTTQQTLAVSAARIMQSKPVVLVPASYEHEPSLEVKREFIYDDGSTVGTYEGLLDPSARRSGDLLAVVDRGTNLSTALALHSSATWATQTLEVGAEAASKLISVSGDAVEAAFCHKAAPQSQVVVSSPVTTVDGQVMVETASRKYRFLFPGMTDPELTVIGQALAWTQDNAEGYFGLYYALWVLWFGSQFPTATAWPALHVVAAPDVGQVFPRAIGEWVQLVGAMSNVASQGGSEAVLIARAQTPLPLTREVLGCLRLVSNPAAGVANQVWGTPPTVCAEFAGMPRIFLVGAFPTTVGPAFRAAHVTPDDVWYTIRWLTQTTGDIGGCSRAYELFVGRLRLYGPEITSLPCPLEARFHGIPDVARNQLRLFEVMTNAHSPGDEWTDEDKAAITPAAVALDPGWASRDHPNWRAVNLNTPVLGALYTRIKDNPTWASHASTRDLLYIVNNIGTGANIMAWFGDGQRALNFAANPAINMGHLESDWSMPADGVEATFSLTCCPGLTRTKSWADGHMPMPRHVPGAVAYNTAIPPALLLRWTLFYSVVRRSVTDVLLHEARASKSVINASHGEFDTGNVDMDYAFSLGTTAVGPDLNETLLASGLAYMKGKYQWELSLAPDHFMAHSLRISTHDRRDNYIVPVAIPPPVRTFILGAALRGFGGWYTSKEGYNRVLTPGARPPWTMFTTEDTVVADIAGLAATVAAQVGVQVVFSTTLVGQGIRTTRLIQHDIAFGQAIGARQSDWLPQHNNALFPALWWLGIPYTTPLWIAEARNGTMFGQLVWNAFWQPYRVGLPPAPFTFHDGAQPLMMNRLRDAINVGVRARLPAARRAIRPPGAGFAYDEEHAAEVYWSLCEPFNDLPKIVGLVIKPRVRLGAQEPKMVDYSVGVRGAFEFGALGQQTEALSRIAAAFEGATISAVRPDLVGSIQVMNERSAILPDSVVARSHAGESTSSALKRVVEHHPGEDVIPEISAESKPPEENPR